jgi:hypothetical protein
VSFPRTRGSSQASRRPVRRVRRLPAHAGSSVAHDLRREHRTSSPHARGSSGVWAEERVAHDVVPARAGVIRRRRASGSSAPSRPRTRGGHPEYGETRTSKGSSSPYARGSSRLVFPVKLRVNVFPICGGHPLCPACMSRSRSSFPARAGVIPATKASRHGTETSSHCRRRRRRRWGVDRVVAPCSALRCGGDVNEIRGFDLQHRRSTGVFPAHAGVIPADADHGGAGQVFPAHAGVIRTAPGSRRSAAGLSRTRGGHPHSSASSSSRAMSFPYARGSSGLRHHARRVGPLLPARAGSSHLGLQGRLREASPPRTRGVIRAPAGPRAGFSRLPRAHGVIRGQPGTTRVASYLPARAGAIRCRGSAQSPG